MHLVFHIGLHKTATTWFQSALFPSFSEFGLCLERKPARIIKAAQQGPLIVSDEGLCGTLSELKSPGDYRARMMRGLAVIREVAPGEPVIVGFREQRAWINAAYHQKAKKRPVDPAQYLSTFSLQDLMWRETLRLIEDEGGPVFPFLYEEMLSDPKALVTDLCAFLKCAPPANLEALLQRRTNQSPKTSLGQAISRPFFNLSYRLGRGRDRSRQFREFGARIGSCFDKWGRPLPRIEFDPAMSQALHEDWAMLTERVTDLRARIRLTQ